MGSTTFSIAEWGQNVGVPRPIWTGSISFGLVDVPVKLLTAVRSHAVRFHQVHAADGARIQMRRVCTADDEEVPYEALSKGYEVEPGRTVVIDPEELDGLDPESTRTIDLEAFVSLDEIDPLYFDSSYYLVPDERGAKAYQLLVDAMTESRRVGVARFVLRSKQYLCAVRALGPSLVLATMRFADEVVPVEDLEGLPAGSVKTTKRELEMARQLIESLAAPFVPEDYPDTYRQRVLDLIASKAEGVELPAAEEAKRPAQVVDLVKALEASLAAPRSRAS